jgi:hypothetical protein
VNGNATAPPMSVMNSRRLTWDMGLLLDVMRLRYTGDRPQEQRAFAWRPPVCWLISPRGGALVAGLREKVP